MKIPGETAVVLAAAVVAAVGVYMLSRKMSEPGAWTDAGASVGGAIVDVIDGVGSGVIVGAGELLGVPQTNIPYATQLLDEWDRTPWYAKAGLSFKISAALPLADYMKWLANSSYRPAL